MNRDNGRGKNRIRRSGIIIILLRSSNFYPYCTQERQSYSVQTSNLSWEWRLLNDERIPSHPSFPACSGGSEPHHPRQEEAAAGDGGRPDPGREGGEVPHHEDARSLAQAPKAIQWSQKKSGPAISNLSCPQILFTVSASIVWSGTYSMYV